MRASLQNLDGSHEEREIPSQRSWPHFLMVGWRVYEHIGEVTSTAGGSYRQLTGRGVAVNPEDECSD